MDRFVHHDIAALLFYAYHTYTTDFFYDFLEEVVWLGDRAFAEGLVDDPFTVMQRMPDVADIEEGATVRDAIEAASMARTGELVDWPDYEVTWKGHSWEIEEINEKYPRLAAHFGPIFPFKIFFNDTGCFEQD